MNRLNLKPIILMLVVVLACSCSSIGLGSGGKAVFSEPVYMGKGREWRPYPLLADFNNDGNLDIICTHRRPLHENSLHVWLGDGDGDFQQIEQNWSSPGYSGLASGDINHDGKLDLVAASHFLRVHTYLGSSDQSLKDTFSKTNDGYSAARLADLDGDGNLDAILLGFQKAGIELHFGDGNGKWKQSIQLTSGIGRDIAIGDLNNDSRKDIVASIANRGIAIFSQQSDGSWVANDPGFHSKTNEFRSIALKDINSDGYLDIILNGGYEGVLEDNGPDVYLGGADGDWERASSGLKKVKFGTEGVAVADFDNDGHQDIIAGGNTTTKIGDDVYGLFLYRGNSKGDWKLAKQSGLPTQGLMRPYGITLGDVNGDGLQDVLVAHGETGESGETGYLTLWLGQQNRKA